MAARAFLHVPEGMTDAEVVAILEKSLAAAKRGMAHGQLKLIGDLDFHHSAFQHRDPTTGQFVRPLSTARRLWAAERAGYQQQGFTANVEALVSKQRTGQPTSKVAFHAKRAIRHNYQSLFDLGKEAAGNPLAADGPELRFLERLIREQFGFLDRFLVAIRDEQGKLEYDDRAHMYGMHGRVAYWLGWVLGNLDPARRIHWLMHPEKEHCESCLAMATLGDLGSGYWSPRALLETGLLPHSGHLKCKGYYCGCELEEEFLRGGRAEKGPQAGTADWLEAPRSLRFTRNGGDLPDETST